MTTEQAAAFVARLETDPAFAVRSATVKDDPQQVRTLVRAEGFDAAPEEIRDEFLDQFGSYLDEEQLAAIAGGTSNEQIGNIAVGVGFGAAAVVGASAAAAAAVGPGRDPLEAQEPPPEAAKPTPWDRLRIPELQRRGALGGTRSPNLLIRRSCSKPTQMDFLLILLGPLPESDSG